MNEYKGINEMRRHAKINQSRKKHWGVSTTEITGFSYSLRVPVAQKFSLSYLSYNTTTDKFACLLSIICIIHLHNELKTKWHLTTTL